jgi:3-hydroxyacyl-CoA dehydrogenase
MKQLQFSTHVKEIKKIGVVGLGLMGHGVAQVSAMAGYEVVGIESNDAALTAGVSRIHESLGKVLGKDVKKGKMTEAEANTKKSEVLDRMVFTTSIDDAHDCDLVIEAIVERMDVKLDFYKNLADKIKPDAIFASNTSSLQITQMSDISGRPANFVGLHFFNPVQLMRLVEVIRTDSTNDEVFNMMGQYVKSISKSPVSCSDTPGFIVNRLLIPYLAQAMKMVDRKVATVPDIDLSMQLGAGHPMGPLHLADYVGLDTCFNALEGWVKDYPGDTDFFVPEVLKEKVAKGEFGRKSGKGFYHWDGDKIGAPVE